ncbi:MAG: hypothetical protein WEG40_10670 [Candidatus Rokuibacteriota bacterium]
MTASSVGEHYENVLSEHYSRMLGDFEARVVEQRSLLERLVITASSTGAVTVDLGCGPGVQSVALARLGFCGIGSWGGSWGGGV